MLKIICSFVTPNDCHKIAENCHSVMDLAMLHSLLTIAGCLPTCEFEWLVFFFEGVCAVFYPKLSFCDLELIELHCSGLKAVYRYLIDNVNV